MLDRLAGLETEYAIRYGPADGMVPLSRFRLYQRLTTALRRRVLVVAAQHFKEGLFTASGGAVWFESERPASGAGLIEGATPECRGARQLITYQRAQDRLLAEAAQSADVPGEFQLIKNDRDAEGNVYGAQENYEAQIGRGLALWGWRTGLVLLFPLVFLSWVGVCLLIGLLLGYLLCAGVLYLLLRLFVPDRHALALQLFGRDLVEGRETGSPTPRWMEPVVLNATRVLTSPLAVALLVHCRLFAFRHIRRALTPLLVSRSVLCGAGLIDQQGRFQLADKAPAINCLVGFGGFLHDRPMFTMGHFFKCLCVESLFCVRSYFSLFRQRQRLQIGLGDSNMADAAEFLRVGTTMLVLDVIEHGGLERPPVVRRPIRALRQLCADPSLRAEAVLAHGRTVTALELQRYYLDTCRRHVEQHGTSNTEVWEILHLWEEALEGLVELKQTDELPRRLVGTLDWVTKKFLLSRLGPDATWAERKKVDLRYHELSSDGYFEQLRRAGVTQRVIEESDIERAMRVAPPNSPATARGRYIREFSGSEEALSVNWRVVTLGRGFRMRVIWLDNYAQRPAKSQHRSSTPAHKRHE